MIHQLIAIKDVKAGFFSKPVAVPSDGSGVRSFQDAVNDKSTDYSKHPRDYSIWNIGTYDDQSGECISTKPVQLAEAIALQTPSTPA